MKLYTISQYSYDKAKLYGVEIQLSENPKKLLDVYRKGEFCCAIGSKQHKNGVDIRADDTLTTGEKYQRICKWRQRHKNLNTDIKFYTFHILY